RALSSGTRASGRARLPTCVLRIRSVLRFMAILPARVAGLCVHRSAIVQPEPAARDPIDEPEPDHAERQPGDEQADAERGHDEERAERYPQQPEPERADLPPEVRLEPRTARLAPLYVVQDDGDDRRPAREEREDNGGGGDDARDEADGVQGVDDVGQPHDRVSRLDRGRALAVRHQRPPRAFWNARSKPGSARTTVSRSTVSEMRMWPSMPKPEPGTVSTPSSASRRTNATSSSIGVRGNT